MGTLFIALVAIIAAIVVFTAVMGYSIFSYGFVLFKFWYWFLLPVFVTLPQITYYQAIGIMIFIGLFQKLKMEKHFKKDVIDKEKGKYDVYTALLMPWATLVLGYLVKLIIY